MALNEDFIHPDNDDARQNYSNPKKKVDVFFRFHKLSDFIFYFFIFCKNQQNYYFDELSFYFYYYYIERKQHYNNDDYRLNGNGNDFQFWVVPEQIFSFFSGT